MTTPVLPEHGVRRPWLPGQFAALPASGFRRAASRRSHGGREIWASFLGAAYFRAVGGVGQWGMSARGVALDVGGARPEEFPDFVAHWISSAASGTTRSWSIRCSTGPASPVPSGSRSRGPPAAVMEIENHLFLRRDIALGIAR